MTDEQKVDAVLKLSPEKGDNDSWFLPVDLRRRILRLLLEERESCAKLVDEAISSSTLCIHYPLALAKTIRERK